MGDCGRRDDSDALQHLELVEITNRPEKVASVTVLELYEAVPQLAAPEPRWQGILDVLDTRHTVATDETVMRKAGKTSGELRACRDEIDREDCIIGATAILTDEPVVIRNADHFERIGGLQVGTY